MHQNTAQNREGVIAILAMMIVTVFVLTILTTVHKLSLSSFKTSAALGATERTFSAAESGINEGVYRLLYQSTGDFSFNHDGVVVDVDVDLNGFAGTITSTATDSTGKRRRLRITIDTPFFGGAFDSAVQTGGGGIVMEEGSCIRGNVYANGSVMGSNNFGFIDGDLTVATLDPMNPPSISSSIYVGDTTVSNNKCFESSAGNKTVQAHAIRCDISGNKCPEIWGEAHYFDASSIDANVRVNNDLCPNAGCITPSADQAPRPLPFDDPIFDQWKTEIDASGNPVIDTSPPGVCPVSNPDSYCIMSGTMTLGYQRIGTTAAPVNLYIAGDATLVLTGNVWVTGTIVLDNSGGQKGRIQLDPSVGDGSVVLFADGSIDINNNYDVYGSGDPNSFLLLATTNANLDPGSPAMYAGNGSASLVYAAHKGLIRVKNVGSVKASAAEKVYLDQNSIVEYDPRLASFFVPPQGGNQSIDATDWVEL